MAQHNCTNPPHFPPHCGCPAGFHQAKAPQPVATASSASK